MMMRTRTLVSDSTPTLRSHVMLPLGPADRPPSAPAPRAALRVVALLAVLVGLTGPVAHAQSADNVLVVINAQSQDSVRVGEYYAAKRAIAADHQVRINAPVTETVARPVFEASIEGPIAAWLAKNNLQDKILYIVLTKGVPLRVAGTDGREGTIASVDSELTLLYRKLMGLPVSAIGPLPNPYYLGDVAVTAAKPFTRYAADMYLVTRLDAFTADEAVKLVDRSIAPATDGAFVLDEKATLVDRGGDSWLEAAAERLKSTMGARVLLETTRALATTSGPVMGYYSWGSNDPSNQLRRFGFRFVNGAIGGMFVSTDGRTFTAPLPAWQPGPTSQSLAADLIRDGITGVSAHVAEPYLDATIRPQILFPAYVAGFNLAEAYYLGMPYLSWQTVVIGDPLCSPFGRKPLVDGDLHKGLDPDLELPALFAERRLALATQSGLNPVAVKLVLKLDGQLARGDRSSVEVILMRATELEPRLSAAQVQLGAMFDERGQFDKAVERYRSALATDSSNVVALNNLAYDLAVHGGSVSEALTLAERAYRLAPTAVVADTLGWIHHLLNNDRLAAPYLEAAAKALPGNADILAHAAVVHGALGDLERARTELDAAIKIDPRVTERAEVKALRERLK